MKEGRIAVAAEPSWQAQRQAELRDQLKAIDAELEAIEQERMRPAKLKLDRDKVLAELASLKEL